MSRPEKTSTSTTTAVSVPERPPLPEKIERALVEGDLSGLSTEERVQFYRHTCEGLGINPFAKPFGYIVLNGKLTLYALKACTDQLRKVHGVAIGQLREQEKDDMYIVFAPATDKTGRTDEDMGAVPIRNLKGEALCNAKMKAVTKAKRRVTLSICGLGMLDETEVVTIPGAKLVDENASVGTIQRPKPVSQFKVQQEVAKVDEFGQVTGTIKTGETIVHEPGEDDGPPEDLAAEMREHPEQLGKPGCITQGQFEALMAVTHKGRGETALREKLQKQFGLEHIHDLPANLYDAVKAWAGQKPQRGPHARIVRR